MESCWALGGTILPFSAGLDSSVSTETESIDVPEQLSLPVGQARQVFTGLLTWAIWPIVFGSSSSDFQRKAFLNEYLSVGVECCLRCYTRRTILT
jgi:hypothetical protein